VSLLTSPAYNFNGFYHADCWPRRVILSELDGWRVNVSICSCSSGPWSAWSAWSAGVELGAAPTQASSEAFTVLENRIGDGDGGLHDLSITGMTHLVCQGCPPGLSGWLGRVAVDVSHLCCGASVLVGPGRVRFC